MARAARSLTLRSSGYISNLVRRAADGINQQRDVAYVTRRQMAAFIARALGLKWTP